MGMSVEDAAPEAVSFSEFARRQGVSAQAVSKALARGRLKRCLGFDKGRPCITNFELAVTEFHANRSRAPAGSDKGLPVTTEEQLTVFKLKGAVVIAKLGNDAEPLWDDFVLAMSPETARALGKRLLTFTEER